jgi:prephenate dehydratase
MINAGYLGPEGTYCHQALEHFRERFDEDLKSVPIEDIPELFRKLSSKQLDTITVPLINSIAGVYSETAKGLSDFSVVQKGCLNMKIDLSLGIHLESSLERISEIWSRDTALVECFNHLNKYHSLCNRMQVFSTAQAMKEIMERRLLHVAAVGGEFGMQRYGLHILEKSIQDNLDNATTFLYLKMK